MSEFSLVNLGGLTRPVTTFIEKVSDAIGAVWEPRQIRRVAQAKADAAITNAQSEIKITELQQRAAARFVEEETRRQLNMESIAAKALDHIDPNAQAENMEDDWIRNFFDKCRNFSDEQMQTLWSHILAGEANSPGSFSRKTVNVLADFDKDSAEMFVTLLRFSWMINEKLEPLVFDVSNKIYESNGLTLEMLVHLESLGLMQIAPIGFRETGLPRTLDVTYHDRLVSITFPESSDCELSTGIVLLTPAGKQIAGIVSSEPVEGFFEFVYDMWVEESLVSPRLEMH